MLLVGDGTKTTSPTSLQALSHQANGSTPGQTLLLCCEYVRSLSLPTDAPETHTLPCIQISAVNSNIFNCTICIPALAGYKFPSNFHPTVRRTPCLLPGARTSHTTFTICLVELSCVAFDRVRFARSFDPPTTLSGGCNGLSMPDRNSNGSSGTGTGRADCF